MSCMTQYVEASNRLMTKIEHLYFHFPSPSYCTSVDAKLLYMELEIYIGVGYYFLFVEQGV